MVWQLCFISTFWISLLGGFISSSLKLKRVWIPLRVNFCCFWNSGYHMKANGALFTFFLLLFNSSSVQSLTNTFSSIDGKALPIGWVLSFLCHVSEECSGILVPCWFTGVFSALTVSCLCSVPMEKFPAEVQFFFHQAYSFTFFLCCYFLCYWFPVSCLNIHITFSSAKQVNEACHLVPMSLEPISQLEVMTSFAESERMCYKGLFI